MGKHTGRAVLDPLLIVAEVPAAAPAQGVERTVAEEAVEVLRPGGPVAGEILTILILKKLMTHGVYLLPPPGRGMPCLPVAVPI